MRSGSGMVATAMAYGDNGLGKWQGLVVAWWFVMWMMLLTPILWSSICFLVASNCSLVTSNRSLIVLNSSSVKYRWDWVVWSSIWVVWSWCWSWLTNGDEYVDKVPALEPSDLDGLLNMEGSSLPSPYMLPFVTPSPQALYKRWSSASDPT